MCREWAKAVQTKNKTQTNKKSKEQTPQNQANSHENAKYEIKSKNYACAIEQSKGPTGSTHLHISNVLIQILCIVASGWLLWRWWL